MDSFQMTLRILKGAPLSVLMALRLAHRPLKHKELTVRTGYSGKTITAALDLLTEMGAVVTNGRQIGWSLTPQAASLFQALAEADADADDDAADDGGDETADPDQPVDKSETAVSPPTQSPPPTRKFSALTPPTRKISVLDPSSSIQDLSTRTRSKQKRPQATPTPENFPPLPTKPAKNQPSGPPPPTDKPPATFYLLRQAGVGISMSHHLSQLEWVTVPYVQAHLAKIKRDGHPLNYAIHRIREGDAPPTCDCGQCAACHTAYRQRLAALGVLRSE